ncbi:MAG: LysR family transcriptional regulator [Elusimicrobiota bacterium]
MIPLNYHHLYYFWAVVKAGSISRAKRRLLLAQPTLSLQLKELEKAFGEKLLNRTHKGISLTGPGRVVFECCERIFPVGEQLASKMQKDAAVLPAVLHIGVEETVARAVVVRMLDFLGRGARGVRVHIVGGALPDLKDRLSRHTVDLLVSDVDLSVALGREFVSRPKVRDPVVFVGSPRLLRDFKRFPRDLAKYPMLLRTAGNPVRKEVDQFLCQHGIEANIGAEIEDNDLIRLLALRGQGIAALGRMSVRKDIQAKRLRQVHGRLLGITEPVWFTSGRLPRPNPVLQKAIRAIMYDLRF